MIEKNGMCVLFIIIIITATIIFCKCRGGGGRGNFFAEMSKDFYICSRKNVVNYGREQEIRLFYKLPPR